MLILAVVTINLVTDSDIFTKGEEAKRKLNEQEIYEKISVSAHTKNTGGIDVKQTYLNSKESLEKQGKTVSLIYPDSEENIGYVSRIIIGVDDYKYTIKTNEILLGEQKYDFEIIVNNNQADAYSHTRQISLKPNITESFFSEKEAVLLVGKTLENEIGVTGIDTLEKLDIEMFNYFNDMEGAPVYGMSDVSDFDSLKNSIIQAGITSITENSTTQDIFALYMSMVMPDEGITTVQQWAAELYEVIDKKIKISLNGEKIAKEVTWSSSSIPSANCIIEKNGIYEFEIEIDGKIGGIIYEVTEVANIGKYVKYDSDGDGSYSDEILFKIFYDEGELAENSGAQIIVADVTSMPSVTLGENDPNIIESEVFEVADDTDISFERALWSYNNATTSLNRACEKAIKLREGIAISVRSVGTNPLNPYIEEENGYITEEDLTNYTDTTWFINYSGKIKKINNNTQDTEKINRYSIFKEESGTVYWTCTKNFRQIHMIQNFGMGFDIEYNTLGIVYKSSASQGAVTSGRFVDGFDSKKIRPIVTLEYGVLSKGVEAGNGEGTKESPILIK